jgi:CRISPR-associated protein Cas2
MWLFAMFDVPVLTKQQRRRYARLRRSLIAAGFTRLQYSVYAKHVHSEEAARPIRTQIRRLVPPDGEVRIMSVTETQFGRMAVYQGKARVAPEKPMEQLLFF